MSTRAPVREEPTPDTPDDLSATADQPPVEPTNLVELADDIEAVDTPNRRATVAAVMCIGTGLVAGGLFTGLVTPRLVAVITTLLGAALALGLRRLRSPVLVALGLIFGVIVIGAVGAIIVGGPSALGDIRDVISKALTQSDLLRPPIRMTAGFAILMGWLMAGAGFGAMWVAVELRRPTIGMLVPLPVAVITAVSVPRNAQVFSGIILLLAFAIGLLILSTDRSVTGGDALPLAYEMRRALKAAPLLAGATILLIILAQSELLFPDPIVNPAFEAQKPKSIPISETPDRVLFEVKSAVTGPWVMGVLDVYDGEDWRLPPFDQAQLIDIPRSGVVDRRFPPGVKATITVRGLGGAVLPTLPNTVGIVARGPKLNYDARSGNIRLVEGEIDEGFSYALAGASVPKVDELAQAPGPPSDLVQRFTQAPAPPPAAQALIDRAPDDSQWQQWDFMRRYILNNITASGSGTPVSITPDDIDEILGATQEASPFEIVAIQTLLARWIGIPARIGYGFDRGRNAGKDRIEIRPRDGAVFPEVYFEGNGWLPVIGTPAKTKVTDASDPNLQQFNPGVLPSDDISVTIFRPVERTGSTRLYEQLRTIAVVAVVLLLIAAFVYLMIAPIRKSIRRARKRADAIAAGPHERIAQSYAEWRDLLTDFGYRFETDTPLMLVRRFPPDDEHNQLAWLVTRGLWGDLLHADLDELNQMAADCEELGHSLQRRLREAHPITVRAVATLSRLSLRSPYAAVPASREDRAVDEVLVDVAV